MTAAAKQDELLEQITSLESLLLHYVAVSALGLDIRLGVKEPEKQQLEVELWGQGWERDCQLLPNWSPRRVSALCARLISLCRSAFDGIVTNWEALTFVRLSLS